MKMKSPYAVFVGAIPGALPPVIGYAAGAGHLDSMALVLFVFLFSWQIPHFLAISIYSQKITSLQEWLFTRTLNQ